VYESFAVWFSAVSEYLLNAGSLCSLSRARERVGVRVCHDLYSAQGGSLALALSQREREMIIVSVMPQ